MKAVLFYCLTCTALLLLALALGNIPPTLKGYVLMLTLLAVNVGMLAKILKGSS